MTQPYTGKGLYKLKCCNFFFHLLLTITLSFCYWKKNPDFSRLIYFCTQESWDPVREDARPSKGYEASVGQGGQWNPASGLPGRPLLLHLTSPEEPVSWLQCVHAKLCQLWDPIDCSQPGSSARGISQARILECCDEHHRSTVYNSQDMEAT